ncbi:type II secretion system F family protein [Demequina zhanjiangensis]|uniref:Type II secretion system F family protein n=1 Tax=Demequina zhanjiangensis TaxID=3051659 RepID=A0ABT8G163_9MICO|nr:type II secretion system F family protein [Demequina sp. SYSU T00b26]MDN4472868.1 type II secretion system F family protein [Demequina sp. SYSU T00b26]
MTAILLGVTLGAGVLLVHSWWRSRTPSLLQRLDPALSLGQQGRADDLVSGPQFAAPRILEPIVADAIRALERWGSSTLEIERRLARAGRAGTADQYRASQVVAGALGLAAGIAVSLALAATRGSPMPALLVLTLACAASGVLLGDRMLSRAITVRERRLTAELPAIAELLALSVSAGEGALGALERVSRIASGPMAEEILEVLARAKAGTPLPESLRQLSDSTGVPAVERFAEAVATAIERGTPLAGVLRAQAGDVRAAGQQELMEDGGRREILMMVPVIFLILPVTVLFAAFPGLAALRLEL